MEARRICLDGHDRALKLRQIVEHAERIVGIELMCAAQGWSFVDRSGPAMRWNALTRLCGDCAASGARPGACADIERWRRP